MERRPQLTVRHRTPRHAHRPRRPLGAGTVIALLGAAVLAVSSIGTTLGVGRTQPVAIESFQAVLAGQAIPQGQAALPGEPVALAGESLAPLPGESLATSSGATDPLGLVSVEGAAAVEPAGAACAARVVEVAAPAASPAPAPRTRAIAAFLGDSYTTGYNSYGLGANGWPAIVSASLGLEPFNRAEAGTGFVNPGWTSSPIRTRVDSVIAMNPRVVFLAGGHNDRKYGATAAMKAASPVIDRLRSALPNALLVIIGPIWHDGSPADSIVALNDQLRRKAAAVGALFIDAIRGGWFSGAAHSLISGDGIHPTNAGHRRIADKVLSVLSTSATAKARLRPAPVAPPSAPGPHIVIERPVAAPCPA